MVSPYIKEGGAKRGFDVIVSSFLTGALAIPAAAGAGAIMLTEGGSPFYRQKRLGRGGVPFEILKFRTMIKGADMMPKPDCMIDPRVTPVGRVLRATSTDELPQLLQVLTGEMSMAGPRPVYMRELDELSNYSQYDTWYPAVTACKQAITGPGSLILKKNRLHTPKIIAQRMEADIDYTENATLAGDIRILAQTLGTVVGRAVEELADYYHSHEQSGTL